MAILPDVRFQFYIHSFSCFLSMVIAGMAMTWLSPLTKWLSSEDSAVRLTEDEVSWLVSVGPIGAIIGAVPAGVLSDRFGRKGVVLATGMVMACSWAGILATRTKTVLFCLQILSGLMVGSLACVAPVYLSEISPPQVRGAIVGQLNTTFFLGQVVVYAVGPSLGYSQYLWVCSSVPILFVAMFSFAPESPYYLLGKGRREEAARHMIKLRGEGSLVELNTAHNQIIDCFDESTLWQVLKQNGHIKNLICLLVLSVVSQANGTAALSMYGEQFVGGRWVTLAMGLVFLSVSLVASLFADPFGRRPVLLISTLGSAIFTGLLATYFIFLLPRLLYPGVFGFCVIASIGINPMIMTLPSELFPTRLRAHANALSQLTAAIAASITLKLFVPINGIWGVQGNFVIASVVSLTGALAVIFLPETAKTTISSI